MKNDATQFAEILQNITLPAYSINKDITDTPPNYKNIDSNIDVDSNIDQDILKTKKNKCVIL